MGKKLKIAWVSPYDISRLNHRLVVPMLKTYHSATWITIGSEALAENPNIELHILIHEKDLDRDYNFIEKGIHFHLLSCPFPKIPRALTFYQLDRWKYYKTLRHINADIVHGHGTENIFSYIAVTSGYKNVISMQAIIAHLLVRYRRVSRRMVEHLFVYFIEKYTMKWAKNVILPAPFVKEFVLRHNPDATLYSLDNMIHPEYFLVERQQNNIQPSVVFVGTLIETKGIEEIIKAFHVINQRYNNFQLDIVGSGKSDYVDNVLKPMIQSGYGKDRIFLHGQLSAREIAKLYSTAYVFVLPSYFDTSPNVVAEAMVSGVPVIATDVGGIPSFITHNVTGLLIAKENVKQLVDALQQLIENPSKAKVMSVRAASVARTRFSKDKFVNDLMKIYNKIITD